MKKREREKKLEMKQKKKINEKICYNPIGA